jgi:NADPH:quinone reductase-like Zn-dependent oxidoreductase
MRSVVRPGYGGPDGLSIAELSTPTPAAGQLLVRVHAATVSRTDCGGLTGEPYIYRFFAGWPGPRHVATGCDYAGEVVAVGAGVTDFAVGARVMGFNDHGIGSHAELLVVPTDGKVVVMPDNVDFDTAAASMEGAHYARNFINKVSLRPVDRVLVYGATGAIGSAAIPILLDMGAEVVAVCGTAHLERVAALAGPWGTIRVIDYQQAPYVDQLRGEQFRFVFDAVGKSRFSTCKPLLTPDGAYISSELGPNAENLAYAALAPLLSGPKVRFPIPDNIPATLALVTRLLREGRFLPLIDRSVALGEIAEAFRYVASGQKIGNLILHCQA